MMLQNSKTTLFLYFKGRVDHHNNLSIDFVELACVLQDHIFNASELERQYKNSFFKLEQPPISSQLSNN
jgi:hypothetical protein